MKCTKMKKNRAYVQSMQKLQFVIVKYANLSSRSLCHASEVSNSEKYTFAIPRNVLTLTIVKQTIKQGFPRI